MPTYIRNLEQIGFPSLIQLDRDSAVDEIVDRIKSDPRWEEIFDGELLQSANFAQINYFAYLWAKANEATNETIRERFITEAKNLNSLYNFLQNFAVNSLQVTAGEVILNAVVTNIAALNRTLRIPLFTTIQGNNNDGSTGTFEFIAKESGTNKFDYKSDIIIPAGVSTFTTSVFAGTTFRKDVVLNPPEDSEKFRIKLNQKNIQDGSIRIYYEFLDPVKETELIETDTFVVTPVTSTQFPTGIPHYVIKFLPDGDAEIIFNTEIFGGSFSRTLVSNLTIFGRTGGGEATNISPFGINDTLSFNIGGSNVSLDFTNTSAGFGGSDAEDENELKFFAPYRIGRGKSIMNDTDAIIAVANYAVKHVVDSPKYSPLTNTVQLLHYNNYIVPKRDLTGFSFPPVLVSDDLDSYNIKFLAALNDFLNLDMIHDEPIVDELMTGFVNTNTSYILELNPPLNGTMYISAYDHDGNEMDRLIFSSNYTNATTPDTLTSKATITATNAITSNITIDGTNNKMKFLIDEGPPNGPGPGTEITITIPSALYGLDVDGKATDLANAIDTAIKAADAYYATGSSHVYAFIDDDKKLNIQSAISGQYSFLKILEVTSSAYTITGFDVASLPLITRALPESGIAFSNTTIYDLDDNTVELRFNEDRFDYTFEYDPTDFAWPDSNSATGPLIEFIATEEDEVALAKPQLDQELIVRALTVGDVIIDEVTFGTPSVSDTNPGVVSASIYGTGDVFNDAATINYNYNTGQFSLQLTDSDDVSPPYDFPAAYDGTIKFQAIMKRETYSFTTVSYQPNPYNQEGEAKSIHDILKDDRKRTTGIEPILKQVDFIPQKVTIDVTPKKGKSPAEAYDSTIALLDQIAGYNSTEPEHTIGNGFQTTFIQSILSDSVTSNPNVKSAVITNLTTDISDGVGNKYYFTLDENFLLAMQELENDNSNIEGFVDLYNVEVVVV